MYSRRPGVGLFLALVLILTVAVPVSAKPKDTTRVVHFGSAATDGTLDVTPNVVFPGGYVDFTAVARNGGNQTLTHATFGLGSQAATGATAPAGPSLPAGWSIEQITPSVGSCTGDSLGAMCDFGSLAGRVGEASVYVLLKTSTTPASGVWASFKIAEQVNDQGGNTDTFYATSNVSAAEACNQIAASKVPGGIPVALKYCSDDQDSAVNVVTGALGLGSLNQRANIPGVVCSPGGGAVCFGDYVVVSVTSESLVTWTFTWDVSLLPRTFRISRLAVIHFPDSGPAVRIAATDLCDSATDVDCTIGWNLTDTTLTMEIRTLENGFGKGAG